MDKEQKYIQMKFLSDIKEFLKMIIRRRNAIYEIALEDLQPQNKNTYPGIIWGYIQSISYIILLVLVY